MYCDCITEPSTVRSNGRDVCCVCGYPQRATSPTDETDAPGEDE